MQRAYLPATILSKDTIDIVELAVGAARPVIVTLESINI
jgi:hypothetical protein